MPTHLQPSNQANIRNETVIFQRREQHPSPQPVSGTADGLEQSRLPGTDLTHYFASSPSTHTAWIHPSHVSVAPSNNHRLNLDSIYRQKALISPFFPRTPLRFFLFQVRDEAAVFPGGAGQSHESLAALRAARSLVSVDGFKEEGLSV